jgi:hypothetical protein
MRGPLLPQASRRFAKPGLRTVLLTLPLGLSLNLSAELRAQTPAPSVPPPGTGTPAPAQTPPPQPQPFPNPGSLFPPSNAPGAQGGPGNAPKPASGDPANAPGAVFDNRLPGFDNATGIIRFNGQNWDVLNNALVSARFEKFLNTPEELGENEANYRAILNKIIVLLDPSNLTPQTLSDAYRLLNRAASFPGDARLCDSLSNAIYSVWQSKRNQARLVEANKILEEEKTTARRNISTLLSTPQFVPAKPPTGGARNASPTVGGTQNNGPGQGLPNPNQNALTRDATPAPTLPADSATQVGNFGRVGNYQETVVVNSVKIKANEAKAELSELQSKLEFQSQLVQLFLQRRFHHLIIGSRFYRALFSDGDSKLNLPDKTKQLFGGTGSPPTVTTLETLANEAIREVQTGVQAFHSLVQLSELDSASRRLREVFALGEFMPEVRTLPRERKRLVLTYAQKGAQLQSALETKDYGLANDLINGPQGLKTLAKDFDATKPMAMIDTARNMSRLHLARARNASIANDKVQFETSLSEAGKIWPNNPELAEVAGKAFQQGDLQAQALNELDQLIAQKNFRRIADEAGRFLAATHMAPPEKQAQLKAILDDFKSIEIALSSAKEMDRLGNAAGAWEALEKTAQKFPDDVQLSQARANYTTKAADFVRSVQHAQEHERRSQPATSLAWFLKAQRLYPRSELAETAIQRLKTELLPGPATPKPAQ